MKRKTSHDCAVIVFKNKKGKLCYVNLWKGQKHHEKGEDRPYEIKPVEQSLVKIEIPDIPMCLARPFEQTLNESLLFQNGLGLFQSRLWGVTNGGDGEELLGDFVQLIF